MLLCCCCCCCLRGREKWGDEKVSFPKRRCARTICLRQREWKKPKPYTQTHDASGAYMTTNELHQHTRATQDNADLSHADISEHDVLYRAAVSRLTWHLFVTSGQVTDTHTHRHREGRTHVSTWYNYGIASLCLGTSPEISMSAPSSLFSLYTFFFYSWIPQYVKNLKRSKAGEENQMNKDWSEDGGVLET